MSLNYQAGILGFVVRHMDSDRISRLAGSVSGSRSLKTIENMAAKNQGFRITACKKVGKNVQRSHAL